MMSERIARVFPRRTTASPDDALAFFGAPSTIQPPVGITAVHVSVAFTYDLPHAEFLADQWKRIAPVQIGGPATGQRGEDFTPGMYLKRGYTITSRGCPNKCWFCSVWKRDGVTRELPIMDGWNVLDDNLLACSESHIRAVFDMLRNQPQRAEFTGGLEAKLLKPWHVNLLAGLKPQQMFFAYDTSDDYEPLRAAAAMLSEAGFSESSKALRCYVLIGHPKDTMADAERRLWQVLDLGMWPMAMLWRDKDGNTTKSWRLFQKAWARPASVFAMKRDRTAA